MPGADVRLPVWSTTRLSPWMPGQFGVPGTGNTTGLRRHVDSRVLYVDPYAPGAADNRDGTEPTDPFRTVGGAIARARPNDVILVMQNDGWVWGTGTEAPITESVVVNVPDLSIFGIAPSSPIGVAWQPAAADETCITIAALNVQIEGFAFMAPDGGNAIYAEYDGTTAFADNVVIRNCFFDTDVGTAIGLDFAWNLWIEKCLFQGCDYGIYADIAGGNVRWAHIIDCEFRNCRTSAVAGLINNSEILGCRIWNATALAGAAATNEGIDLSAAAETLVANCSFSCIIPGMAPANGDWDDLNSGSATTAWVGNHCTDGLAVTTPT
jgi:hypothetical protein